MPVQLERKFGRTPCLVTKSGNWVESKLFKARGLGKESAMTTVDNTRLPNASKLRAMSFETAVMLWNAGDPEDGICP